MFIVNKKETGKTVLTPIVALDTRETTEAKLLKYFETKNINKGPNKQDAGSFYELVDGKYIETKNIVTETPAGYIFNGSRDVTSEQVAEYEFLEIPAVVMRDYTQHILNKNKNNIPSYKSKLIAKPKPKPISKNLLTIDMKYSVSDIKNLPVGTILISRDNENLYHLAKIIKAYDTVSETVRLHYNNFNAKWNETKQINQCDFYKTSMHYDDEPIVEYDVYDNYDLDQMRKLGLVMLDDTSLNFGDIVEYPTNNLYDVVWHRSKIVAFGDAKVIEQGDVNVFTTIYAKVGTFTI